MDFESKKVIHIWDLELRGVSQIFTMVLRCLHDDGQWDENNCLCVKPFRSHDHAASYQMLRQ